MKRAAVLLPALVLASCMTQVKRSRHFDPEMSAPPEAWQGVRTVTVFPPDNWTNDVGLDYIAWYRAVIHELLREKGYAVTPLAQVNRFMLKNRFVMAGELAQYGPAELAQEFGSDVLLFWDITGASGRVNINVVKGDGTPLWNTGEVDLRLKYRAISRESFHMIDRQFALALGEVFRKFPPRP